MIKQFWASISSIGIKPDYHEKQIKRVILINQYTLIAFLLYVINGISDLILGFTFEGVLLEASSSLFILSLYLNKLHHHRFSATFFFIFIGLSIFYFGSLAGVQSGDYLYYFPLILAISFAFDFSKDKYLMFFLFFFILALIFVNTLAYSGFPAFPESGSRRYHMFVVNLMLSILSVGFFIYLAARNNQMISSLYEQRIREREKSETTVKKALREKEVLLAELHHRVKNNLAIIVSFFNLKLNNTHNEEARDVLLECKNRVNSMNLIHNHLYKKEDFSEIDFGTYILDLVKEIRFSYPALASSVAIHSNIANIKLSLNLAIPCALILNELLTNCYKHTFKNRDQGIIKITFMHINGSELKLVVSDDGPGLIKDFNKQNSMGITVIEALSEQLNGKFSYVSDCGASFELVFDPAQN